MQFFGQTVSQAWQPQQSSFRLRTIISRERFCRAVRFPFPRKSRFHSVKHKRFLSGFSRRRRQLELFGNIAAGDENDNGFGIFYAGAPASEMGGGITLIRRRNSRSVFGEADQFSMQCATRFL